MDINSLTQFIGAFGFPIVACCVMGWFVKYQMDTNNAKVENMIQEHRKEMAEVTTALNNNTIAIQKLCVQLGGENNE